MTQDLVKLRARKIGGSYQAIGTVVSRFQTLSGKDRVVFEFDEPNGMLHIFDVAQIEYYDSPAPAQGSPEAVAWKLIDPSGQVVATEATCMKAWARIDGYKPTVEGLLGYEEKGWRVEQ